MTPIKIAVFASGTGSNFDALANECAAGNIDAEIVLMVCDKPNAACIHKAIGHKIPSLIFNPKEYDSKEAYEQEIVYHLEDKGVQLICLAGYMRIVGPTLLEKYTGSILNIHPALLPSFKGAHAIDDAFNFGVKVYGVTIHWVDQSIDGGQIVAQKAFQYEGNNRQEVERRIHAIEHKLYPSTLQSIIKQRFSKK